MEGSDLNKTASLQIYYLRTSFTGSYRQVIIPQMLKYHNISDVQAKLLFGHTLSQTYIFMKTDQRLMSLLKCAQEKMITPDMALGQFAI